MSNDSEDSWMDVDGVDIQNLSLGLEDFGILDGKGTLGEPSGKFEDLNMSKELLHKFRTDAAKSFFNQFGVINHQINSFNDFMENGIYKFFDSIGEYHVQPGYKVSGKVSEGWKHATITFGKVTIEKPSFLDEKGDVKKLTPREARFQNVTYSSRVNAEVTVKIYVKKRMTSDKAKTGPEQFIYDHVLHEEKGNMLIGRIPIMVKSNLCSLDGTGKGECDFDYGGYFLIKGAEKIFVAQEQRCLRRLWVSKVSKSPNWMVTSYHPDGFRRKIIHIKLTETPIANGLNGGKTINVLFLYATIPVWILFFALGASSDKEIVQIIDMDIGNPALVNILRSTINDADHSCNGFRKNGKALEYLQDQIRSTKFPPEEPLDECLEKYLFPSLKGKHKALFLGYMVKCLLLSYFGQRKLDNRDDFRNKRLELASALLGRELRICFRHALNRMGKALEKDLSEDKQLKPIECYFDAWLVTNGLNSAFSSGKWSNPLNRTERTSGVVATLKRANPLQMIAEMRKTRVQIQYMGKLGDARFPNPSFWGRLCIISTPDDENCGLVKNLAVTCLISTSLPEPSLDKLKECGMETLDDISPTLLSERERVFLNGDWVGCCKDSSVFVHELRSMRRSMLIHPQVEIKRDRQQREVRIFSDEGRILRPLLIVENNRICFSLEKRKRFESSGRSFKFLLEEKLIEFIGTEEEEDCVVAWVLEDLDNTDKLQLQYTHLELDPSFLLGFSCGIIPFANHNNARRVLYQAEKHSKQAIGFNSVNPSVRVDTLCHQLYYPQKPLFKTVLSDCLGKPEYFNGQNAIVAVNVHQGYNQEDSLVMNRASLERGMFRTEHFRSYKDDTENREAEGRKGYKPKERVDFGKPGSGYGRIDSIEDDGFPFVGANLTSNDIVIGKVGGLGVKLKHTEKGMVQRVVVSSNDDGKNFAVVTLRQVRSPCLGDKFSSMHGQKGVVGFIESQENFPFTREGIVPDIVINPHAFPTRQTPSQLLEAALGKGIACGGTMSYATPFTATSFDAITDQLHRNGFSRWGSERVYDGRSGKKLQSLIFMGPTFYQRLVHMAEDKVKFRNRGPVHPLTRQPVADRKRFGGVKFGEMERDCLLAHGAAANLYERLFVLSDFSQMFICRNCQRVANVIQRSVNKSTVRGPYCQFCKSAENIVKINVPYGAKLLYQELFSMGICLKFDTELT